MADTRTEHLNLIKQDPEAVPDYLDDHSNLEILDEEVWKRGKAFNGQPVGEDGGFHIRNVPYAENLETSSSQSSDADFIIRTTGGDASLMDGDAWLTLIKGTMTHTGYVPQSITMTVTPMARPTPPEITATLNNETFIAYVQQPGEYTISYTTSWSESPATYGITVSNDPINGDSITVVWDGEDDPVMTVNAVPRQAPESIAAVIDDSVFVAYVTQSGTTTLTYGTAWSADPALYGITVTGTPIAGDVITVVYVKEVRGTIIQSTPETFVSTGWNLYNHTAGYARVIKYSTEYNFKISGAYTALEFASTPSGTRTTITPVSGAFSIPSDGYIIVTGGNSTTTAIWMTWSDWVSGYNWDGEQQGDFAPYSESVIDFGTFMATNFPYGLMQVGTAQDEINFNIGIATSKVLRLAYNDTNLATAKASGRQYEYDENYIYLERETPVTYSIDVDGAYAAFDHGMEYFTGTEQAVYAQTLYGQNLKNKLERDVLTISQQTLTSSQQAQVRTNIGIVTSELGSFANTSAVETALVTLGGTMTNNQFKNIRFSLSASSGEFINTTYLGTITRYSNNYYGVDVLGNYRPTEFVQGTYVNGTWHWNSIKNLQFGASLGTITSLAELTGALDTKIQSMSQYESLPVWFQTGSSAVETIGSNVRCEGYLKCVYASGTRKDGTVIFTGNDGTEVHLSKLNGNWRYNDTNSKLSFNQISASSLSDFTNKIDAIMTDRGFYTAYVSNTDAALIGLNGAVYFLQIMAFASTNILVTAYRLSGEEIRIITKPNGTWKTSWTTYDTSTYKLSKSSASAHSFTVPSSSRHIITFTTTSAACLWVGYVQAANNGALTVTEITKGNNVTVTTSTSTITFTIDQSRTPDVAVTTIYGAKMS